MDKASIGRVIVKVLPNENSINGFRTDYTRQEWGELIAVGPPSLDLFSNWQILLYRVTGIHPAPWREGDLILMPTIRREYKGEDGSNTTVFFQGDISAFRKQGGDRSRLTDRVFGWFKNRYASKRTTSLVNIWASYGNP